MNYPVVVCITFLKCSERHLVVMISQFYIVLNRFETCQNPNAKRESNLSYRMISTLSNILLLL